jgi:hypothetical protein
MAIFQSHEHDDQILKKKGLNIHCKWSLEGQEGNKW